MPSGICGIYCIENIINNKKYIGQSRDIKFRLIRHKTNLRGNYHVNQHLQSAWNYYGENNFIFYIIKECDIKSLNMLEEHYIKLYDTFYNGYNLNTGGDVPLQISETTREKMKLNQNDKSRPIYQIDLNGNILKLWEHGAVEASRELNCSQSGIWDCLNTINNTYTLKGFIWIYKENINNFDINNYINRKTQPKTIKQIDLNGNIVKIWESANSTSNFGFNPSAVISCCKGRYKTHKGYMWEYLERTE